MSAELERRVAQLRAKLVSKRVLQPGQLGLDVALALERALLATEQPCCGVMLHTRAYGGSVPEGWLHTRTLVLPDAVVTSEEFDPEGHCALTVQAFTEERAAELEALAKRLHAELQAKQP